MTDDQKLFNRINTLIQRCCEITARHSGFSCHSLLTSTCTQTQTYPSGLGLKNMIWICILHIQFTHTNTITPQYRISAIKIYIYICFQPLILIQSTEVINAHLSYFLMYAFFKFIIILFYFIYGL